MKTVTPPSFRQRMLRGARAVAVGARLARPSRSGGSATILLYHSLADGPLRRFVDPARRMTPEDFDRHCAWLARHRKVISLGALVECLRSGGRPEPGSVVITFDGGYLDTANTAAPILARHGLRATLFVSTDAIDASLPFWGDRLYTAFRMRRRKKVEMRGRSFDLTRPQQELVVYRRLCALLTACDAQERAGTPRRDRVPARRRGARAPHHPGLVRGPRPRRAQARLGGGQSRARRGSTSRHTRTRSCATTSPGR